jgi:hypothetical protein
MGRTSPAIPKETRTEDPMVLGQEIRETATPNSRGVVNRLAMVTMSVKRAAVRGDRIA